LSRQDGKDTLPFIDWQLDQASKSTPLPTPRPDEAPRGFIGFTRARADDETGEVDLSVVLTSGRLSKLDREAVQLMTQTESGHRVRSVTEYSFCRKRAIKT